MPSEKNASSTSINNIQFSPRQAAALEHALQLLAAGGEKSLTAARLARAAGCSRKSLYRWFGNRDGMLSAMITYQASKVRTFYQDGQRLTFPSLHCHILIFARDLLDVLGGDLSLALNRLAIGQSDGHSKLRTLLLEKGRDQIDRRAKKLIYAGQRAGLLRLDDTDEMYHTLYGLIVSDLHVHMLLGGETIGDSRHVAEQAVRSFIRLYGTGMCFPEVPSDVRTKSRHQTKEVLTDFDFL